MARDYKKEYRDYHSKRAAKKIRARCNTNRNRAEKEGRVKKGDGKHVDHVVAASKGGGDGKENLRVVDAETNWKKSTKRKA